MAGIFAAASHLSSSVPAAPPPTPLAAPLYSFDLPSPTVMQGAVDADDVLTLNQLSPATLIPGAVLGLGQPGDELDALSSSNSLIGPDTQFVLLFSVNRDTVGTAQPDPALVALGYIYNVVDQAARGHQAGDEFMSLLLFSRAGPDDPQAQSGNNTLVRNNYDEGGTDFAAQPQTSAHSMSVGQPQDNVDALAGLAAATTPLFSASGASPSLSTLPGTASGANIFRSNLATTTLYATFSQLGLQQADDVDAAVVFDTNSDGVFNGSDQVLFSLAPGSPSLSTLAGASAAGAAADVFSVSFGAAPQLFASAAQLGLGAASDDIDALDILPCVDPVECAVEHAIRLLAGDFDGDGVLGDADHALFGGCISGEGVEYAPGCEPGDFDQDSDVDCADYVAFSEGFDDGPPGPLPAACIGVIPTISQSLAALLAGLLLVLGAAIIRRRQAAA